MNREPLIVGVVGNSNSGKTTLITRVADELASRGYRVGTAKNCPHGFDLGSREKDSWNLLGAGSRATLLTSPQEAVFLRRPPSPPSLDVMGTLKKEFFGFDVVLAEGYKTVDGMQRIVLITSREQWETLGASSGVVAVVSDEKVDTSVPVFGRDEIGSITSFLEDTLRERRAKPSVQVYVNGTRLRLKLFVKDMIRGVLVGLIGGLKRDDADSPIREIVVRVLEEE
jgi:molybdopterin-guanine dinucleotide biosynthesis protein B